MQNSVKRKTVLMLILAAASAIIIACSGGAAADSVPDEITVSMAGDPTPVPTSQAATLIQSTPISQPVTISQVATDHEPNADGLCVSAGYLAASIGDTWTLSGPIASTGNAPSDFPADATSWTSIYTVASFDDVDIPVASDRSTASERVVNTIEDAIVFVDLSGEIFDAVGNVIDTSNSQIRGRTISVGNLGPVLTTDWECHSIAWTNQQEPGFDVSVEETTLPSGVTVVLFKRTQELVLPNQGISATMNIVNGYDKESGRVVFIDASTEGTMNGDAFSLQMSQSLHLSN